MAKVHIGTMGWSYNFWKGSFYPKELDSKEFLREYPRHFDTVEADSTFYRVPYKSTVTKWREQTTSGFLFSVKFPKVITHQKMLKDSEEDAARFIDQISLLQGKLGPLLLQFPPQFGPSHANLLSDFLHSLPKHYRFAVEVRNVQLLDEKLCSLLRENQVALVFTEAPLMSKVEARTSDFVYIIWEGDRKRVKGNLGKVEVDRTSGIKKWAEKIKNLVNGSTEVFGYFSKYYSGNPAADAEKLLAYLRSDINP